MADEYMEGFSLTNEILNPGVSTTITQGGTSFDAQNSIPTLSTGISNEQQKADMQSILDLFHLNEELPDESDRNDLEDDDLAPEVDLEDQRQRTEHLRGIYPALDRLWWTGSDYMIGAAEKLADGSRDRKSILALISSYRQFQESITTTYSDLRQLLHFLEPSVHMS